MSQQGVPGRVENAAVLWDRVQDARSALTRQRKAPLSSSQSAARVVLLEALEAYAAALTRHSRPIPYAMRDELALMRLTRDR